MREWFVWIVQLVVGWLLVWYFAPWLITPLDLLIVAAVVVYNIFTFPMRVADWFGNWLIDFIYSTNSRGLGDDYDFHRVEAQYQRLWWTIMTAWYLTLYASALGLLWVGRAWLKVSEGDEPAFSNWQWAILLIGGALWLHFIFYHFLPQLAATQQRLLLERDWGDDKQTKLEAAEFVPREADSREEETSRPPRRDPFYKGETAEGAD